MIKDEYIIYEDFENNNYNKRKKIYLIINIIIIYYIFENLTYYIDNILLNNINNF